MPTVEYLELTMAQAARLWKRHRAAVELENARHGILVEKDVEKDFWPKRTQEQQQAAIERLTWQHRRLKHG